MKCGSNHEEEKFLVTLFPLKSLARSLPVNVVVFVFFFLIFVYVFNALHEKRRHTCPKQNKRGYVTAHDDTRDTELLLLARNNEEEEEEEMEGPPKVNLWVFQIYELKELC